MCRMPSLWSVRAAASRCLPTPTTWPTRTLSRTVVSPTPRLAASSLWRTVWFFPSRPRVHARYVFCCIFCSFFLIATIQAVKHLVSSYTHTFPSYTHISEFERINVSAHFMSLSACSCSMYVLHRQYALHVTQPKSMAAFEKSISERAHTNTRVHTNTYRMFSTSALPSLRRLPSLLRISQGISGAWPRLWRTLWVDTTGLTLSSLLWHAGPSTTAAFWPSRQRRWARALMFVHPQYNRRLVQISVAMHVCLCTRFGPNHVNAWARCVWIANRLKARLTDVNVKFQYNIC